MLKPESNRVGLKILALIVVILAHVGIVFALLGSNTKLVTLSSDTYLDQTAGQFTPTSKIEFFEVADIPAPKPVEKPIAVESEEKPDVNPVEPEPEPEPPKPEPKPKPKPTPQPKPTPKPQAQPKTEQKPAAPAKTNEQGRQASGTEGSGKDAVTSANHLGGYLNNPKPNYPFQSLERGEQGTVILSVVVEANGKPSRVTVKVSSGYPRLDRAALNTVRDYYTFVPATRGGVPVQSTYEFAIEFNISNR